MKMGQLSPAKGFLAPPKPFQNADDKKSRSRSSSFSRIFSSSDSSPRRTVPPLEQISTAAIPPELVPIVTLLSAQAHRRYHEGVFLILKDLNSDGSPAARTWKEVYGVLIGTQLAVWDARVLADNGNNPEELLKATAKPTYINFTDASFRPLGPKEAVIAEGKKQLNHTIVASTTLKNRYFLQFSDADAFAHWHASLRLSAFEFTALQEAYTGAFLSTKGAKLGDIRVILADTKFNYEDWVSVRFGAGMPWKRCYAVISQPTKKSKSKRICGEINFYENDKKTKKAQIMTSVTDACAVYALYPSSPMLIDTSTMIKLEGRVSFGKKDTPKETDIFIMPEKHHAVPGYDTIIRFLIPTMNAFQLYGRPKRLIADRHDLNSLLFGLPTLPHVHFLQKEDIISIAASKSNMTWSVLEWREGIKNVLLKKVNAGYTGCGSSEGLNGALASPAIGSNELFDSTPLQTSPLVASISRFPSESQPTKTSLRNASGVTRSRDYTESQENVSSIYTDAEKTPQGSVDELAGSVAELRTPARNKKATPTIEIQQSNFENFERAEKPRAQDAPARKSELSTIYDKYSQVPFGTSEHELPYLAYGEQARDSAGAYEDYTRSPTVKNLDISNLRDSNSTDHTEFSRALRAQGGADRSSNANSYYSDGGNSRNETSAKNDVLEDFYSLSQQISQMGLGSKEKMDNGGYSNKRDTDDFDFEAGGSVNNSLDNVFDPDYLEQNQMLDNESHYTNNESKFRYGVGNPSQQSIGKSEPVTRTSPSREMNASGRVSPLVIPKQRPNKQVVTPTSQKFHPQEHAFTGRGTDQSPNEKATTMKHSPGYANLNAVSANRNDISPVHGKQPAPMASGSARPHHRPIPRGVPMGMPQQMPMSQQVPMPQHMPMPQQVPMPQQMPMSQQVPMLQQVPIVNQTPAAVPRPAGYGSRSYSPAPPTGMSNPYGRQVPANMGAVPPGAQPVYARGPTYGSAPPPHMKPMRPVVNQPPAMKPATQKPRSPMAGGFSQFMPATANYPNPYSANPYQQ
ncbi:LAME_0G01838g1_1 [Lachancea meyersii CBS 8951]|uniref:LAME_0G01838g1_1 n=1 Tax=Lachancea meyersii CBS 8951 TaxID=1266667 RepID=A0A1G4K5K9_9SACH|nr:LAME_0G01838g1_1 [Lachancea meyersii CBS 8951]